MVIIIKKKYGPEETLKTYFNHNNYLDDCHAFQTWNVIIFFATFLENYSALHNEVNIMGLRLKLKS